MHSCRQAEDRALGTRVFVDLSVIVRSDARTGIQRVVRALYRALRESAPDGVLIVPVAADAETQYRVIPTSVLELGFNRPLAGYPLVQARGGDAFLGLDLASTILPRHVDQLDAWRRLGATIHIIIYDLLPVTGARWFKRRARVHFRRWLRAVEKHADSAICISEATANQFRLWQLRFPKRDRRLVPTAVIPMGSDIEDSVPSSGIPEDAARISSWIARGPTILAVGTIEPRKAHDRLLAAFEQLWKWNGAEAAQLLVVGRPGWKTAALQMRMRAMSSMSGSFLWLEDVSDEFLLRLYDETHGVVLASHAEGFGLPVIEALANGKRVLVRDLPVFREINADLDVFVSDRTDALATSLLQFVRKCSDFPPSSTIDKRCWASSATSLLSILGVSTSTGDDSTEAHHFGRLAG